MLGSEPAAPARESSNPDGGVGGTEDAGKEDRDVSGSVSAETYDALLYICFMVIFCVTAFGMQSSNAYFMKRGIDVMVFDTTISLDTTYYDISSTADVWNWITGPMSSVLLVAEDSIAPSSTMVSTSSSEEPSPAASSYIGGGNFRMGALRLRFQRVRNDTCTIPPQFAGNLSNCFGAISSSSQSTSEFLDLSWSGDIGGEFVSFTTKHRYPAGGYVLDFGANYTEDIASLALLDEGTFMDEATRSVFVDFSVYNPNVNMFSVVTAVMELLPSGVVIPSIIWRTASLLQPYMVVTGDASPHDTALFVLECVLYAMVLAFLLKDLWRMYRAGGPLRYFNSVFRVLDFVNYVFFIAVMGLKLESMGQVDSVVGSLPGILGGGGGVYVDFVPAADAVLAVDALMAFNAVFVTLRFFDLMRTIPELAQFTDTIIFATKDLASLMVAIFIIISAYSIGFQLGFGNSVTTYFSFSQSFVTLFKSLLGDFDVQAIRSTNRFLGPVLVCGFVVTIFLVIITIFIVIVNASYEEVRELQAEKAGSSTSPIRRDMKRAWRWMCDAIKNRMGRRGRVLAAEQDLAEDQKNLVIADAEPTSPVPQTAGSVNKAMNLLNSRSGKRSSLSDRWTWGLTETSSKTLMQRLERLRSQQLELEKVLHNISENLQKK
jgi:hypothetical protein